MKKFALAFLALATALAITPLALATTLGPVSGSIGVIGFTDSWSATSLTFNSTTGIAGGGTGTLATILGSATLDNLTFLSPDGLLFSTVDGVTFTITGPIDVLQDTPTELEITGTGTLTENNYDNTPASFTLDSEDDSGDFGAKGSSTFGITAATPEPSSLLLLGSGLLSLALVVFWKAKANRLVLHS
jgi:hypothetical protein